MGACLFRCYGWRPSSFLIPPLVGEAPVLSLLLGSMSVLRISPDGSAVI